MALVEELDIQSIDDSECEYRSKLLAIILGSYIIDNVQAPRPTAAPSGHRIVLNLQAMCSSMTPFLRVW